MLIQAESFLKSPRNYWSPKKLENISSLLNLDVDAAVLSRSSRHSLSYIFLNTRSAIHAQYHCLSIYTILCLRMRATMCHGCCSFTDNNKDVA